MLAGHLCCSAAGLVTRSERQREGSALAEFLLQRLSAISQGGVDSQQKSADGLTDVQRGRVDDWTPPARCKLDCVEDIDNASSPLLLRQQLAHTVKRQLDLNIVLSNYIKHRLGKHEDQ